jgi:hydrogenase maturation protease
VPDPQPFAGHRSRVVGLGTPFGDDRAGWEVVERLRERLPPGTPTEVTSDPLAVLECVSDCELLIVIDACRGADPRPGTLHRFEWPDPRLTAESGVSSHGVGLTAALELAAALGRLPPRVVVFAIEGEAGQPGAGLSRAVELALPGAVAGVLAEVSANATEPPRRTP